MFPYFSFHRELCRAADREVFEKGSVKVEVGSIATLSNCARLGNGKYASPQRLTVYFCIFGQNTGKKDSKGPKFLLVPRDFRVGMSVKVIHERKRNFPAHRNMVVVVRQYTLDEYIMANLRRIVCFTDGLGCIETPRCCASEGNKL